MTSTPARFDSEASRLNTLIRSGAYVYGIKGARDALSIGIATAVERKSEWGLGMIGSRIRYDVVLTDGSPFTIVVTGSLDGIEIEVAA